METAEPDSKHIQHAPLIHDKGKQPVREEHAVDNDAPQDTCVICLERITERAVAVPCNHLNFDFLCLVSWLQEQPTCPLCKAPLSEVQYDWRTPEDYKTYAVPTPPPTKPSSAPPSSASGLPHRLPRRGGRGFAPYRPTTPDSALAVRRRVYAHKLHSLHVGANRVSQYRNFTPSTFSTSHQLQSRAKKFIRRELQVFSFLHSQGHANAEFLLEYIIAILKKIEIKDASGTAEDMLQEFLGRENARLFLHELEQWLRSPYERLEDWDRHVQYPRQGRGRGKEDATDSRSAQETGSE